MGCIFYFIGAFFIGGGFYVGGTQNIITGLIVGIVFIALGHEIQPHDGAAFRRKAHAHAQIISDTQIQINNLDDVDVSTLDRWHVSMLKVRTRMGNGTWVWEFDKPMGPMGTQSEQEMYMREAVDSINTYIDNYINPAKDKS